MFLDCKIAVGFADWRCNQASRDMKDCNRFKLLAHSQKVESINISAASQPITLRYKLEDISDNDWFLYQ